MTLSVPRRKRPPEEARGARGRIGPRRELARAVAPLERPGEHLVVATSIGTLDSLELVLDTGAERSSVTVAVARRLGITDSLMSRDTVPGSRWEHGHGIGGPAVGAGGASPCR